MFRFPFGTTQELNLDWFLEQWEIFKQEAQTALDGIDHALDDEIQRVEDAMTDLYAARDAAIAAKNDALSYAQSANTSAIGASQSAQNSAASAVTSATQAQSAAQSASAAAASAASVAQSSAQIAENTTDIEDLKSAITPIVTNIDSTNLISGGLTVGYYTNTNTYNSSPNFSYVRIPVTGISKVQINGSHHVYTPEQFASYGVVVDSSDTLINSIVGIYGSVPQVEPFDLEIPANAAYILLNTDYNSSYYPTNPPDGLTCFAYLDGYKVKAEEIIPTVPLLNDISQGNRKIKILAGAIRNTGSGWTFINDSGHQQLNMLDVTSSSDLRLNYGFTAKKVISLIVAPDETFAEIYKCGASVGNEYADVRIFQRPISYGGRITYSDGAWSADDADLGSTGRVSYSTTQVIIYHDSVANFTAKQKYEISITPTGCDAVISSVTDTGIVLNVSNVTESAAIYFMRKLPERRVGANYITSSTGNFWVLGVMEVE